MVTTTVSQSYRVAEKIPNVSEDEAFILITLELERLLSLLETLDPPDWNQPTACTAWNVREIVAHQAGGYSSGVSYREMFRQYARIPRRGQLPEDAVNAFQLRERAGRSPKELISELRHLGPLAARNWAYRFHLAKLITIPHPVPGTLSLRHLMMVIHSRDTWMHRLDICRATGRDFEQTPEHDGRIVALVVRDVAQQLNNRLAGRAILLNLFGISGGAWKIGQGEPAANLHMHSLDFCIFVSGRNRYDPAALQAFLSGDQEWANALFRDLLVLF